MQRGQAEAEEQRAAPRRPPTPASSVVFTRQATSSTVGSSAADSSALTGAGASLCASGSQLWTGAQPIFVARPARISTKATSSAAPAAAPAALLVQRVPVERAQPVLAVAGQREREHDDAQQRDRQPERRQHEVLPAGLERVAARR